MSTGKLIRTLGTLVALLASPAWLVAHATGIGPVWVDGSEWRDAIVMEVVSYAPDGRPERLRIAPPDGEPRECEITAGDWNGLLAETLSVDEYGRYEMRAEILESGVPAASYLLTAWPTATGAAIEIAPEAGGEPVKVKAICGGFCIGVLIGAATALGCQYLHKEAMEKCLRECSKICSKTGGVKSCHYHGTCGWFGTDCRVECYPPEPCRGTLCPEQGPF